MHKQKGASLGHAKPRLEVPIGKSIKYPKIRLSQMVRKATKVRLLIKPDGKSLSARDGSGGWTQGVFLFFFGGYCGTNDESSLQGGERDESYTNQVARFNTRTDTWSNVETSGAQPKPRTLAGLTKLRDKVYLMGGQDAKMNELNDVRILDLKTFA
jgi:hypothetical protein